MSDVKRYSPLIGLARNAKLRRMEMQCDPQWVLDMAAERDALRKDGERLRIALGEIAWSSDSLWQSNRADAALNGEQP